MNIAIVGTSNSVLKDGWVKYFSKLIGKTVVENFSIGGHGINYVHYALEKHRILDRFDYCIFDFAVNDQNFMDGNPVEACLISKSFVCAAYLDLIRKIRNSKCKPIFMIFPIKDYIDKPQQCLTRTLILNLCNMFGYQYVDGYSTINAIADMVNCNGSLFFRDANHLNSIAASRLAFQVIELLYTSGDNGEIVFEQKMELPNLGFRIVEPDEIKWSYCELISRKTSIANFNAMYMGVNSEVSLKISDCLCGCFAWLTNQTGDLDILMSRNNYLLKMSIFSWIPTFNLRHFYEPLEPNDETITIRISNVGSTAKEAEIVDFLAVTRRYKEFEPIVGCWMIRLTSKPVIHRPEYSSTIQKSIECLKGLLTDSGDFLDDLVRYRMENIRIRQSEIRHNSLIKGLLLPLIDGNLNCPLILFGAGGMGQKVLSNGYIGRHVCCIVDNSKEKWGTQYNGIPIQSPDFLDKKNEAIIIVTSIYYDDIKNQLIEKEFVEGKDFFDGRILYN